MHGVPARALSLSSRFAIPGFQRAAALQSTKTRMPLRTPGELREFIRWEGSHCDVNVISRSHNEIQENRDHVGI